jgi:cytochrome P450 / NADPH-cytochrome P450 reductase
MSYLGRQVVIIGSHRLAVEVLDEKRFHKAVAGGLQELRNLVGDGLFTAQLGEPNWAIARTYNGYRVLTALTHEEFI